MKKNKTLPLIILVSILMVLIAAYVFLSDYNSKKAAEQADSTTNTEPEIIVTSLNSDDITAISYISEDIEVTLSYTGGKWIFPDDEKYPIDQSAVNKMLSAVSSLSASRLLDGDDFTEFGLNEPVLTVTATANGTDHVFVIGNVNSYNDLTYLGYNGKVYMISDTFSPNFEKDKDDLFAATDSFPSAITSDSVTSVTVTNDKGDSATVSDDSGIDEIVYEAQKYISFSILKGYGLDTDGLASYGITEGSAVIVIDYDYNSAKASFDVMLGKNSEGECFYTVPGSTTVYGIDGTGYDKLMSYAYYTYVETTAE